jgi:dihydrofolate reductase
LANVVLASRQSICASTPVVELSGPFAAPIGKQTTTAGVVAIRRGWLGDGDIAIGTDERLTVAKLIYSAIASLDGYIEDEDGNFDWAEPDEEVHAFVNDLDRPVGTYLYGRRMYEVMVGWETDPTLADQSPLMRDFAEIWQAADKIVYSKTLANVSTARTRIERDFDPEAVRQMKASADRDLIVGGPELAAHAFKAGLVDECHLFVTPIIVGGGKQSLPDNVRLELALMDERRFGNGVVYLHYRTRT